MTGTFIAFEGPEGGGKSTQLQRLAAELRSRQIAVVTTREPGGTALGDRVRSLLLELGDYAILPETEVLLLAASRAQHVHDVIAPALSQDKVVLCDRYVDSTYAYQVAGRGLELESVRRVQEYATGGLEPDLRVLLDLPVESGLRRRHADPSSLNRIDLADIRFHQRVRDAYLAAARSHPEGWAVIDAGQEPDVVAAAILRVCGERLDSLRALDQPVIRLSTDAGTLMEPCLWRPLPGVE